jgi:hypothetical protein
MTYALNQVLTTEELRKQMRRAGLSVARQLTWDAAARQMINGCEAMSRPLNFLHLTTFYPPYSFGGDVMYIYRLAHALADEGPRVDVVHCADAYQLLHPGEPEIKFAGHPNVMCTV